MLRKYPILMILTLVFPSLAMAQSYLPQFTSAIDAQRHCPYDTVVWVTNPNARHGTDQNPNSANGGYVCKYEAINAGYGGLVTHLQPLKK